jgi:hypothetical protein
MNAQRNPLVTVINGRRREPRYTTPAEQARIRRCVQYLAVDAGGQADRFLIDRYTYLFRTVFNSMLRDRQM